jgi:predicted N-acetyltransferase YhbS
MESQMSLNEARYCDLEKSDSDELGALFRSSFTASEGDDEGRLIGDLAGELGLRIDGRRITGFGCIENAALIAAIFFTRLDYDTSQAVVMLAPVAVATPEQGRGIGSALITHGLDQMSQRGATIAVTYGDPDYYGRFGFEALSTEVLQAPLPLSMPHGWLGRSLTDAPLRPLAGRPQCVSAFRDPRLW